MNEFIFTFGAGQTPHGLGKFVSVMANSWEEARAKMVERFGSKWAFQYASRKAAGVERFGLICVGEIL